MTAREKAAQNLTEVYGWLRHLQQVGFLGDVPTYRQYADWVHEAMGLLNDKPEPVKNEAPSRLIVGAWTGECPACRVTVYVSHPDNAAAYCSHCGQALQWCMEGGASCD